MNINQKINIAYNFREYYDFIHDISCNTENEEIIDLNTIGSIIDDSESRFLYDLPKEYNFFKGLHVQTKYDNIISLIKIAERLDIELDIVIDIEDIDYDMIWDYINEQIETPQQVIDFINKVGDIYHRW